MAVNGKRQGSYSIYKQGRTGHANKQDLNHLVHVNKQDLNHLVHVNKLAYLCVYPGALSCVLWPRNIPPALTCTGSSSVQEEW